MWLLVLGGKTFILAKHFPGLGLAGFLDAIWPQLLTLGAVSAWGYIGLVLTQHRSQAWFLTAAVSQGFLSVLLMFMELPLLFGMERSGSAVRWTLAAWWIEFDGIAADGDWYMYQRFIAVGVLLALFLGLALAGSARLRTLGAAAGSGVLLGLSSLGPLGSSVPVFMARDAVLYMAQSKVGVEAEWDRMRARPVASGLLAGGDVGRPLNVAVVFLESVGHDATSLGEGGPPTTPFLKEMAADSLQAEEAYVVVPSTYKAHVAALCGVEPYFTGDREIFDKPFDFRCLPSLLRERGYQTVYFTSSGRQMLGWPAMVKHLGFDQFLGYEDMEVDGFEPANLWAYEDDIMLAPSAEWIGGVKGPFIATYMASTPHFEYLAPTRYGRARYVNNDEHNRYLNAVHYVDRFLENLVSQYRDLGLLEHTLFVVVGDHGEGFGEHAPRQHNASPYEEAIRVPMMIRLPESLASSRGLVSGLTSQLDLTPTLAELLDLPLERGSTAGLSLLGPTRHERVFASCLYSHTCASVRDGEWKLIHHFGDRPDQLFHVVSDRFERRDVASEQVERGVGMQRELLQWYFQGL